MPELPEVEVARRALAQAVTGKEISRVAIRVPKLRLPVPPELTELLPGRIVRRVDRRGKYLLFSCDDIWLVIHLGMTGVLRVLPAAVPPGTHDHLDIFFKEGTVLRFNDPRKFGTVLWTGESPLTHALLTGIGPEPLEDGFDGAYLFAVSRSRTVAVKQLIMNSAIVAGVGNIYANEALFRARINPLRPSCSLNRNEYDRLAAAVREVLTASIAQGSTIGEFLIAEDTPRYHPLDFQVYGRKDMPCVACGSLLSEARLGNRSTVYCPSCQDAAGSAAGTACPLLVTT